MMLQKQLKGLHRSISLGVLTVLFVFFFSFLFLGGDGPVNSPARGEPGLGTQETRAVSTLRRRAVSAHHSRAPS